MVNRRADRRLLFAVSWFLLGPCLLPATAQLLGPEFQVNTYTTSRQTSRYSHRVAADSSGHFIVVWASFGQDGSGDGVFGQRFDPAGNTIGSEFRVNSFTTGIQYSPSVAADGSGNFVVAWRDNGQDGASYGVFGQWFDSGGGTVGSEFPVNSYTTGSQLSPAVAADGLGNFVVVWTSTVQDGSSNGIFGQRYDSAGSPLGSEFPVNSYTTNTQFGGAVAADDAGNFVVTWTSHDQDSSYFGVFGQRFDSAGSTVDSDFQVNSYTTENQQSPSVAVDGAGNFVVVWEDPSGHDGDSYGIFGQRYDAAGDKVGSEFQVNSFTTNSQRVPSVAADESGNFVVVWHSNGQDLSLGGVFGQRFDPLGGSVGSEFQLNSVTTDDQSFASVATNGPGRFVVTWESLNQDGSNSGLFARQLSWIFANGFELGKVCSWSTAVGSADSCSP